MNYNEALEYIHGTRRLGWKLGLDNIRYLLNLMNNPQKELRFVHVAGTNGKGSTVAFLSSILIEAGYKVGTFTSPYLERFTERIKVGSDEIEKQDLARITEYVKAKVDEMVREGKNHPTEFEIVTAIALQYFYEKQCDIVVLEVGLGGRFDSTNVIDTPLLSVITTISYDHMDLLGNTLEEIAFEKAGIIKENGSVLLYPQQKNIQELFRRICRERGATLNEVDFTSVSLISFNVNGQIFNYKAYNSLKIQLLGEHQVRNAILAVESVELLRNKGYIVGEESIRKGLINAKWPGRLEVISKEPIFIIDGAHNAEGAKILRDTLDNYFQGRRKIFIVGVLKDKDYKSIIKTIMPLADQVITVTPKSERALPAEDLAIFVEYYCKNVLVSDTIEEAIKSGLSLSSPNDVICAFGSFYYIGEVRKFFNALRIN